MKKVTILSIIAFAIFLGKSASAEQVEVKSGDTLSEISETYKVSIEDLVRINNIENPSLIYVGDIIETEDGKTTASTTNEKTVEAAPTQAAVVETTPAYIGTSSSAKEWIAQRESGGSYTATNGIYIGRYQLTASYLNGDYSPENQERVADAYVAGRYGSWENAMQFWLANGWY